MPGMTSSVAAQGMMSFPAAMVWTRCSAVRAMTAFMLTHHPMASQKSGGVAWAGAGDDSIDGDSGNDIIGGGSGDDVAQGYTAMTFFS